MAFGLMMEALARIEYKLDALLRWTGVPMPPPMHFTAGQLCPACGMPVDFIVDINHQVVVRRCNCKTGKVPSTFPLVPVTPEKTHGIPAAAAGDADVPAEDGDQRRPGGPRSR